MLKEINQVRYDVSVVDGLCVEELGMAVGEAAYTVGSERRDLGEIVRAYLGSSEAERVAISEAYEAITGDSLEDEICEGGVGEDWEYRLGQWGNTKFYCDMGERIKAYLEKIGGSEIRAKCFYEVLKYLTGYSSVSEIVRWHSWEQYMP